MRFLPVLGLPTLLAFSLLSAAAHTPEAHDVSGTYSVKSVTSAGEKVILTLALRLHNSGEVDFSNSKAVLLSSLPGGKAHAALEASTLRPHSDASVTQTFTISREEYEMWRKGAKPALSISAKSADASSVTRTIRLMPLRAGEGN